MHRIDTPTAQIDKFGAGKNGFTNGEPSTGRRATDLNSDMWDAVQEEICNVVEKSGLTLNKEQHDQLYQAIGKIITSKIPDALIRSKNLSDLLDTAIARANLELKSAAIKDVVTSQTDSTTGRIPVVGWMGLGGNSIPVTTASNADLHKLPPIPFNAFREYKSSDRSVYLIGISGISPSGNLVEWLAPETGSDGTKVAIRNKTTLFTLYSDVNKPPYPVTSVNGMEGDVVIPAPNLSGYLLKANAFGINQTWRDVTLQRALNTAYTNSSGKPIYISVTGKNQQQQSFVDLWVGSAKASRTYKDSNSDAPLTAIIPVGATYKIIATGGTLSNWAELS